MSNFLFFNYFLNAPRVTSCKDLNVQIIPVLVTPVTKVSAGALPHLINVSLWNLSDFKQWTKNSLSILREIRKSFNEPGDLIWRAEAATTLKENNINMSGLVKMLKNHNAKELLDEF